MNKPNGPAGKLRPSENVTGVESCRDKTGTGGKRRRLSLMHIVVYVIFPRSSLKANHGVRLRLGGTTGDTSGRGLSCTPGGLDFCVFHLPLEFLLSLFLHLLPALLREKQNAPVQIQYNVDVSEISSQNKWNELRAKKPGVLAHHSMVSRSPRIPWISSRHCCWYCGCNARQYKSQEIPLAVVS